MSDWLRETSRSVYCVGPLLPSGEHAAIHEKKQSANSSDIEVFMDRVLESHGAKSLVYVRDSATFLFM